MLSCHLANEVPGEAGEHVSAVQLLQAVCSAACMMAVASVFHQVMLTLPCTYTRHTHAPYVWTVQLYTLGAPAMSDHNFRGQYKLNAEDYQ